MSPYAERVRVFLREHTHRAARTAAVTRGCVVALLARPESPPEGYELAACPLCGRPLWISAETKTLAAENAVPAACVVCALRGAPT